jgi:transketolase
VLIGTGSELNIGHRRAGRPLEEEGIVARVVSMPCTRRFDLQPLAYRQQVLPPSLPAVAIEAGHPDLWWKYVGGNGAVVGIDRFGESAPAADLYDFFAINVASVVAAARRLVKAPSSAAKKALPGKAERGS